MTRHQTCPKVEMMRSVTVLAGPHAVLLVYKLIGYLYKRRLRLAGSEY